MQATITQSVAAASTCVGTQATAIVLCCTCIERSTPRKRRATNNNRSRCRSGCAGGAIWKTRGCLPITQCIHLISFLSVHVKSSRFPTEYPHSTNTSFSGCAWLCSRKILAPFHLKGLDNGSICVCVWFFWSSSSIK